jgi:hypothetical protein
LSQGQIAIWLRDFLRLRSGQASPGLMKISPVQVIFGCTIGAIFVPLYPAGSLPVGGVSAIV